MSYHRGIVEDKRFTEDFDSYRSKYADLDDLHEWLTWTLTENPRAGEADERAPDYRYLKTPSRGDIPAFWVLYTFDENSVYLHSLYPVNDDH